MFIYDLVDPQVLVGFVRNLAFPTFSLNRFLPDVTLNDIEYRFTRRTDVDQDVAPFRAWDAEAAIGGRQGLARVMGEIPPLSKKIRLGEEQRLRLRALQGATAPDDAIVRAIFDDAANMMRSVQARIELARGGVLSTGVFTDIAADRQFRSNIPFGVPGDHFVTPTTVWSTVATATIIKDLRTWLEKYVADNGVAPGAILTSTRVLGFMLQNAEIRTLAGTLAGTPAMVTPATVATALSAYGLPPIETYDVSVRVAGVATKVIPDDLVLFLPPAGEPLGATFNGVTAEALELTSAGQLVASQAPGVVAVVEKTFDPVSIWTKASAVSLPILANPSLLMVADVL